ncbi:WSC domain-containing protein [Lachnellula hyalina]|uniref:Peroxidase n=1 Tax=Lachnellula hyalina TaxID=1316788 RepID=A0A8H8QW99_9HELO|nr:WSC domain-containing protein [Lachnellula hyalina]TVY22534.1 WSC domain-containing protein [Lachnellula hyalina]
MVPSFRPLGLLPLLMFSTGSFSQLNGIDMRDRMEEMEHIWVDNNGANTDGFVGAVSPCSNYVGPNGQNRGEQSSAQWVRFVFHDSVTANLAAGTGGVDASLGFESDRPENLGLFVNDTLRFMSPTVSAYTSMSDNIALGLIASLAECGGTTTGIPLRVGRIDAEEAGPAGVPEPTTDLKTTLAQFAAAGFNQSETIALTACGHSLGRIHFSNFPDIVDASAVTSTNINGGVGFDATPAVFDNAVVTDYIGGTGAQGGLLVTAGNVSDRSDFRLYVSDNNVTMQALSVEATFQSQCNSLFERMINTVPAAVTLSDPITPMTWKAVDIGLDITPTGAVSISGYIRNLYYATAPPTVVYYDTSTANGTLSAVEVTTTALSSGTSIFGYTVYYGFNNTIASPGTTSLNFEGISYPVNDEIFILTAQSTSSRSDFVLKAAALTSLTSGLGSMTGVLYVPERQQGTVVNKIVNTTVPMTAYATAGNYTLFSSGSVAVQNTRSVIAKVLLGDSASRTVKGDLFAQGA